MQGNASFGYWVRRRRKALDLTQEGLAQRVGCSAGMIRMIEADERRPSRQLADRLAAYLELGQEEHAAFLKAARAELAVDRLASPISPQAAAPAFARAQQPGQGVLKGYELREHIGSGGFGAVYRAHQRGVGREVAVKIILPQYANHPNFIRRFEAEAQLVARLEHPHIVPLYDYWREPGGAYLVMRWARGGNLTAALRAGPWPLDAGIRLLEQLAAALTYAHRHQIVHRDLKPPNILLDEEGNAYLADFGIAKDLVAWLPEEQQLGSPVYLSPEQIRDEPVTPQTDIYSLGVLLYELLTGTNPFADLPPAEMLTKQLHEPLPLLGACCPDLPTGLDAVIQKATAKRPADRYSDALSLAADFLRAVAAGKPAPAEPASTPQVAASASERVYGLSESTGAGAPGIVALAAAALSIENPYKGLRAFDEADAADFFGREALVRRLLDRMAGDQEPRTENREPETRRQGDKETGRPGDTEVYDLQRAMGNGRRTTSRFLAVVGPSGSGKSSVVRAGLIPALRRGALPGSERWFVIAMLPGAHPLEELEAALLRVAVNPPPSLLAQLHEDERGLVRAIKRALPEDAETELVLVIDQFEEAFTLVEDEAARIHMLNSLHAAATDPHSRVRVIVTLRADFYDRPLLYPDFGELVRQRTEVVLPLTAEELRRAIVCPAERVGVTVEPELVAAIVRDVGGQPGVLPLLQYALTELFERRAQRSLTQEAYVASGGLLGALTRRAEEIYAALDAPQQQAARQLFLRLVTPGEDVQDIRRRVARSELAALPDDRRPLSGDETDLVAGQRSGDNQPQPPGNRADTAGWSLVAGRSSALDAVIDAYGKYRLLTFDRDPITRAPTVEVAHEALIRAWSRLRDWLDSSRDDLRLQRRLARWAGEWASAGCDPSFLATGARLAQFESLALPPAAADPAEDIGGYLALNRDERAYLEASIAERDRQAAAEREGQAHRAHLARRARNVLRALVVVLLLATVGSLTLAGIARRNALEAQNLALVAGAQAASSKGDTDLALALALAANQVDRPLIQAQLILADVAYAPGTRRRFLGHSAPVRAVAFSPDGRAALSAAEDRTVILWDLTTGALMRRFPGHADKVTGVAFSPDGRAALSSSEDKTLILWDIASGQVKHPFVGHTDKVNAVAFSPDGRAALSGSTDKTLILWDIASGQVKHPFVGHTDKVNAVAFSPDGSAALSGSDDKTLILWDLATGQIKRRLVGHTDKVNAVAFSPNGRAALSGSDDRALILWDLTTGQPSQLGRQTDGVLSVAFSPDGSTALSGSRDARLGMWNVATGEPIRFFAGHSGSVLAATFSPDGRAALSGSADTTLRLWDLDSGAEMRRFIGHSAIVRSVAFSSDGRGIFSASDDKTLILWDAASGQLIQRFLGHKDAVNSLAPSPKGDTVLSTSGDGTLILWDIASGRAIRHFEGHQAGVTGVAFNSDGNMALSSSLDKTLILWDVATGEPIRPFVGHNDNVYRLKFSPDGSTALSASGDQTLILWDIASGRLLRRFRGHSAAVRDVAFSPDGGMALSGSDDATLILWDVATGEPIRPFAGHSAKVYSVAFSPDGRTALSGSADSSVILWDVATAQPIRRFLGHSAIVRSVAFSPDGRAFVSSSVDTSIGLWRIDSRSELIAWAIANRYIPQLTCENRILYRLESACDEAGAPSITTSSTYP